MCVLYYKCKYLLSEYQKKLKVIENSSENIHFIASYLTLTKIVQDVYNSLILPTTSCSLIFLLHLFVPVYLLTCWYAPILKYIYFPDFVDSKTRLIEFSTLTVISLISVATVPVIMHEIQLKMGNIRDNFNGKLESEVSSLSIDYRTIEVLKVIVKKKYIKIPLFYKLYSNRNGVLILVAVFTALSIAFLFKTDVGEMERINWGDE
ncbi:hypothetical protein AVEN_162875-1 [Araneus ventricosus]|uniref:Uncharacterized protein n=1 Tax=Araneus ventricosus TaxID=182803 RepID=A0A4Y2T991_ARAVE|nr:hypothetical protein AVEN_162875-1 [Araneus ventricosus]